MRVLYKERDGFLSFSEVSAFSCENDPFTVYMNTDNGWYKTKGMSQMDYEASLRKGLMDGYIDFSSTTFIPEQIFEYVLDGITEPNPDEESCNDKDGEELNWNPFPEAVIVIVLLIIIICLFIYSLYDKSVNRNTTIGSEIISCLVE